MRLRCRFGIHEWNDWELISYDSLYYSQKTKCKCCGMIKLRKAMYYSDRYS